MVCPPWSRPGARFSLLLQGWLQLQQDNACCWPILASRQIWESHKKNQGSTYFLYEGGRNFVELDSLQFRGCQYLVHGATQSAPQSCKALSVPAPPPLLSPAQLCAGSDSSRRGATRGLGACKPSPHCIADASFCSPPPAYQLQHGHSWRLPSPSAAPRGPEVVAALQSWSRLWQGEVAVARVQLPRIWASEVHVQGHSPLSLTCHRCYPACAGPAHSFLKVANHCSSQLDSVQETEGLFQEP